MKHTFRRLSAAALAGGLLFTAAPAANAVPSNVLGVVKDTVGSVVTGAGADIASRLTQYRPHLETHHFVVTPGTTSSTTVTWRDTSADKKAPNRSTGTLTGATGTLSWSGSQASVNAHSLVSVRGDKLSVFLPANAKPGEYTFDLDVMGVLDSGLPVGGKTYITVYVPPSPVALPGNISVPVPEFVAGSLELVTSFSS